MHSPSTSEHRSNQAPPSRARARALRAAKVVTLALALGGCYGVHERGEVERHVDAGPPFMYRPDAGPRMPDGGPRLVDSGPPLADSGVPDAGDAGPCIPDPDCGGGGGGGTCDWEQFSACCETLEWNVEPCWLPGGPMRPPEMPV